MPIEMTRPWIHHVAERWWVFVLRGIVAILFGALAFTTPGITMAALVIVWGAYAISDGVLALITALRRGRAGDPWVWLVFHGLIGIAAGVVTFVWPGITAMTLLIVIGLWAVMTGVAEIGLALRLRKEITNEWLVALSGVLSIAFGALMLARPGAGALAVVWMIGAYAFVLGVVLIAAGIRLRSWHRKGGEGRVVTGGTVASPA